LRDIDVVEATSYFLCL